MLCSCAVTVTGGLAYHACTLHPSNSWQVHSMIQRLAQFTDIQAALVVGGLSLQAQAATLRAQPEIVVATPVRALARGGWGGTAAGCCFRSASQCHALLHSLPAALLPLPCMHACDWFMRLLPGGAVTHMGRRQRSGARATKLRLFRLPLLLIRAPLCSTCAHLSNQLQPYLLQCNGTCVLATWPLFVN